MKRRARIFVSPGHLNLKLTWLRAHYFPVLTALRLDRYRSKRHHHVLEAVQRTLTIWHPYHIDRVGDRALALRDYGGAEQRIGSKSIAIPAEAKSLPALPSCYPENHKGSAVSG
jgi:hypothetical protein